jgi:S1-C subfamily serine protease
MNEIAESWRCVMTIQRIALVTACRSFGNGWRFGRVLPCLFLALAMTVGLTKSGHADPLREALDGLVMVIADVPNDARTSETLGPKRRGTGVAIDDDGLIVTIGYVILEADQVQVMDRTGKVTPAEIVSYDHDTGFGLIRALAPIEAAAVQLGKLADHEVGAVLYAAAPGEIAAVELMEKRAFAGGWEYLLEVAAFTSPPIRNFGGAALLDEAGKLVGIGSLIVPDAGRRPGNMFVPIELLPPILGDLLAFGRSTAAAPPWLGLYPDESRRGLVVSRVAREGPADSVGISPGDRILGVGDDLVSDLETLWRRVRSYGPAGSKVPLRVFSQGAERNVTLTSRDRRSWLKLDRSY